MASPTSHDPDMEPVAPPTLWRFLRYWVWLAVALGVLAVFMWFGRDWYSLMKAEYQHSLARDLLAKGDGAGAVMAARNAIMANPEQGEATLMMARMAQSAGSSLSVQWWSRAAELYPDDNEVRFAQALAALEFRQFAVAHEALNALAEDARDTAQYHRIAGGIALEMRDYATAKRHFIRAHELTPESHTDKLNAATLELLTATNQQDRDRATKHLEELRGIPSSHRQATRVLLRDAISRQAAIEIMTYANALASAPNASFSDRLLQLQMIHTHEPRNLPAQLKVMKEEAASNPQRLFALLTWMTSNDLSEQAITWADTLPEELRENTALGVALLSALGKHGQWQRIATQYGTQKWVALEFLRLAWQARAARELRRPWKVLWSQSIAQAGNNPSSLRMLVGLTEAWGWESEQRLLWERLTRVPSQQGLALRELYRHHRKRGDTAALLSVFEQAVEANPDDATARNNRAALQLILNRNQAQALNEARDLLQQDPDNPGYATTYALGCLRLERPEDGIAALERLPPSALAQPETAVYYGLLLEASGRSEEALPYLQQAEQASFLPEEQELMERALLRAQAQMPRNTEPATP